MTPPAIIQRRATPNPRVQRPVLTVKAKPAVKRPRTRTLACALPLVPRGGPPLVGGLPLVDLLPAVAGLPAVPSATWAELLEYEPPSAGPLPAPAAPTFAVNWASMPPPQWHGPQIPATAPVVPEPPTILLALLGVGWLVWKVGRK